MTDRLYVGASGFSYPTWKPGFYPAGTPQSEFLRFYAERLPTVELNTTGYRLPEEERFRHWAAETPDGFRFAVKMPHPNRARVFTERCRALGEKLGPVRIVVQQARDDAFLARLLDSLDPALRWALGPVLADGLEVYAYFKHEDAPTAPAYATRLRELAASGRA